MARRDSSGLPAQGLQRNFLKVFDEIDSENRGVVTHEDLKEYAARSGLADSFVTVSPLLAFLNARIKGR